MKTLKLLIKTSFFNKMNDFLCFNIIKYIFNRISNKVFISYINKTNTFNQDVLYIDTLIDHLTYLLTLHSPVLSYIKVDHNCLNAM